MEKRKIKTRVLTFVSTFIILCSIFAFSCFAQSNDYNYIDYGNYYVTSTVYTPDNSTQSFKSLCYLIIQYDSSIVWNVPIDNITVYYTDYFYNNYYSGDFESDIEIILDNPYLIGALSFVRNGYPNSNPSGYSPSLFYEGDLVDAYNEFATINSFLGVSYDFLYNFFELNYNNQFLYWENEIQNSYSNGYNEGQTVGYNDGLTVGYTNALNDSDTFIQAIFKIFEAPFVFVQNITGFELFGIRVFDIFSFFIIISVGIFLFNKLRRFLPL